MEFWTIDSIERFTGKSLMEVRSEIVKKEYSDIEADAIREEASHYVIDWVMEEAIDEDGTPVTDKKLYNRSRETVKEDEILVCDNHFCGMVHQIEDRTSKWFKPSMEMLLLIKDGIKVMDDDVRFQKSIGKVVSVSISTRYARISKISKRITYIRTLETGEEKGELISGSGAAYDVGRREYSDMQSENLKYHLFRDAEGGLHLVRAQKRSVEVYDPEGGGPLYYYEYSYVIAEQSVPSEDIDLEAIRKESFWCNMSSWGGERMILSWDNDYWELFRIKSKLDELMRNSKDNESLTMALSYWMRQTHQSVEEFFQDGITVTAG